MDWKRSVRKGAAELGLLIAVVVVGYLTDNAAEFGIGGVALWALEQARRALRDLRSGAPD